MSLTVAPPDVSPVMVGSLRRRADEQGLANLIVAEAGFLSYRHAANPVDFVYTGNARHRAVRIIDWDPDVRCCLTVRLS